MEVLLNEYEKLLNDKLYSSISLSKDKQIDDTCRKMETVINDKLNTHNYNN
jgi:hypothetical protein